MGFIGFLFEHLAKIILIYNYFREAMSLKRDSTWVTLMSDGLRNF